MAFFNPLGALSALAGGAVKGYTDEAPKLYDLMGMQALGRAFQQQPGPIDQQNAQRFAQAPPQAPQPPMPGQASIPGQPPMGPPPGPMAAPGGPPATQPPAGFGQSAGGPMSPQGPPQGMGGPPPGMPPQQQPQGGMPQLDLQTLIARINKANPNLPPQAMVAALTRAVPLLNVQGKQDLALMRMDLQQQIANARLDQGDRRLDQGDRRLDDKSSAQQQTENNAADIGEAVIKGDQPPTLQGLYRMAAPVKEYLAKKGFNQSKAILEYNAAQKQIQALNGPQMTRYAGLAKSVVNTIDEVKALAEEMENSGIPLANRAKMAIYAQTQGNTPKGQLVARYMAGVNTLKEEFANLAQGGYAPTESAWKLADQQINGDYGVKQLNASLDEVQRLINYRLQGIPNFQNLGPGAGNRYTGQGGQQPQGSGGGGSIAPGGGQIIGGGAAIPMGNGWSAQVIGPSPNDQVGNRFPQ